MISTADAVEAIINSKHGWAVAEQFRSTFDGEDFEEQNSNALRYIEETTRDIFKSNILNEDANDELEDYITELKEYMLGPEEKEEAE